MVDMNAGVMPMQSYMPANGNKQSPNNIFMPEGPNGKARGHDHANPQGQPFQAPAALEDVFNLSPETRGTLTMMRAQFQINYQSMRSVSSANGTIMEQRSFSFSGSFEFLQVAAGEEPINMEELDGQSIMEKMQELFSPEKTAGRILDFALAHYQPKEGDSEEARSSFADTIGAAIQKGFDQAQNILGKLEDSIQEGIDQTHEIVFDGLADFVTKGLPEDHADRSQKIREYAQQWQMSVRMEYQSISTVSYNSRGQVQAPTAGEEGQENYQPFEAQA